jgi:hypothetical protein
VLTLIINKKTKQSFLLLITNMKSVIGLAVVAACVIAAPLKKVVDLTKFNDNCLTCLLADGVFCEGEK